MAGVNMQSFILKMIFLCNLFFMRSWKRIKTGRNSAGWQRGFPCWGGHPQASFSQLCGQYRIIFLRRRMDCFYSHCLGALVWQDIRRLPHCSGDWCRETELDGMYCMGVGHHCCIVHTCFVCWRAADSLSSNPVWKVTWLRLSLHIMARLVSTEAN